MSLKYTVPSRFGEQRCVCSPGRSTSVPSAFLDCAESAGFANAILLTAKQNRTEVRPDVTVRGTPVSARTVRI